MATADVFLIMPLGSDPKLERLAEAVQNLALPTFDDWAPQAWFVHFDGKAKQLSERLAGPEGRGDVGTHLVTQVDRNYWGYGSKEMWSWLAERM